MIKIKNKNSYLSTIVWVLFKVTLFIRLVMLCWERLLKSVQIFRSLFIRVFWRKKLLIQSHEVELTMLTKRYIKLGEKFRLKKKKNNDCCMDHSLPLFLQFLRGQDFTMQSMHIRSIILGVIKEDSSIVRRSVL